MHLIRPFAGLRPAPAYAAAVAAPPYDVLSTDEARVRAAGKPWSFLHISKPEIDLPAGTDPHALRGLRESRREPAAHAPRGRARARSAALLLRLPPEHGRACADRARGGGFGGRVRDQPHPQARAHPARQGGRPGAADRSSRCADRSGPARLPAGAAGGCCSPAGHAGAAAHRRRSRRRGASQRLGAERCPGHRRAHCGLRRHAGAVHRRRASPLGRRCARRRCAPAGRSWSRRGGELQLFPRRRLPAPPAAHPRLQPAGQGPEGAGPAGVPDAHRQAFQHPRQRHAR